MSEIVKGARVRVTYEGVVTEAKSGYDFIGVTSDSGQNYSPYREDVEVLGRVFEDGAFYLSVPTGHVFRYKADGDTFRAAANKATTPWESTLKSDSFRNRLVKLVPETT